ncbi:hypothetical protein [Sphingomonas sp. LT1P40]|uniref:hypothetical protein n=1 Tax=Alteristakelama amylovorans TaxID=3096166 RepID=UPI002FC5D419
MRVLPLPLASLRALWLATLGLLLAFHATVSTPTATAFSQDEWRVAKVTAAARLAVQFRESGQTVQVARASALSFKAHDGSGDGNPHLPGKAFAFGATALAISASDGLHATAFPHSNIRDAYSARAPPVGLHAA